MGANNVEVLKLLGATKKKPFFRLYNQETATVYESPLLLVCTWNLFLKHDVQTQTISPVVQADRHPPEPHCTEHYESELGSTGIEL
jgi:hypothetical protein